ncbi:MAG: FecR family protein [Bacteroides sp.]|nr:FecR family protein [Bacteroides sp.]
MTREIPWNIIVSNLKKESTADEDSELERWLSDSGNKEIFEELRELWNRIQSNASTYAPDKDYYWKELSQRMSFFLQEPVEKSCRNTNWWTYVAAACAIIVIIASFYVGQWTMGISDKAPLQYISMGGKAEASLPDQSSVWLHTDTKLVYDMSHQKEERVVTLRGEAFF